MYEIKRQLLELSNATKGFLEYSADEIGFGMVILTMLVMTMAIVAKLMTDELDAGQLNAMGVKL